MKEMTSSIISDMFQYYRERGDGAVLNFANRLMNSEGRMMDADALTPDEMTRLVAEFMEQNNIWRMRKGDNTHIIIDWANNVGYCPRVGCNPDKGCDLCNPKEADE